MNAGTSLRMIALAGVLLLAGCTASSGLTSPNPEDDLSGASPSSTPTPEPINAGEVWAWGTGLTGRLGIPNGPDVRMPAKIETQGDVVAVAQSPGAAAIRADGTVLFWGWSGQGALGIDATSYHVYPPAPVEGLVNVVEIKGFGAYYALDAKGKVWVWGGGSRGEFGDGVYDADATYFRASPAVVDGLPPAVAVDTNVAVGEDGLVYTWGCTRNQECLLPTPVPGIENAVDSTRGLALTADGKVFKWDYTNRGFAAEAAYEISFQAPATAIFGGGSGVVLLEDGTVWERTASEGSGPVKVNGVENIVAVGDTACPEVLAVDEDGYMWVWSPAGQGQDYGDHCDMYPDQTATPWNAVRLDILPGRVIALDGETAVVATD